MTSSPQLEHREAIRYVAIAGSGRDDRELRAFADRAFPAVFGAVGELGLTPTGAPFFRLFRFVPGGEFEVEVGVPVEGGGTPGGRDSSQDGDGGAAGATGGSPVGDDGQAQLAVLPAGRYAVYVHEGAYSADDETWEGRDLASAHAAMEDWASEQGLRWATGDDGRFGAVVEQYLVGPAETSDVASWRTLIAKRVED